MSHSLRLRAVRVSVVAIATFARATTSIPEDDQTNRTNLEEGPAVQSPEPVDPKDALTHDFGSVMEPLSYYAGTFPGGQIAPPA